MSMLFRFSFSTGILEFQLHFISFLTVEGEILIVLSAKRRAVLVNFEFSEISNECL